MLPGERPTVKSSEQNIYRKRVSIHHFKTSCSFKSVQTVQKRSETLGCHKAGGRALVGLLAPDPCQPGQAETSPAGTGNSCGTGWETSITSAKGRLILPEGTELDSVTAPNPFRSTEPVEKQIFILQKTGQRSAAPLSVPSCWNP